MIMAKKSLQKFADSEAKINNILKLEQITPADLKQLSEAERTRFTEILTERANRLKGTERDKFYEQTDLITTDCIKNQLWESNHNQITYAISILIQEHGRMPSKTEIANKTELSRPTIYKHLKEYTNHPLYLAQIEQFKFMTAKVLAKVFSFAMNGDMGAAKLYFNIMGSMNSGQTPSTTLIQNQNNYIQINGTVLSQEAIKHLSPAQLSTIETILKTVLPQPEVLNDEM